MARQKCKLCINGKTKVYMCIFNGKTKVYV